MNEHQLAIGETTFGGREELSDSTGIMDYGSLIYITLQRAKNAREAIRIMTDLVRDYGYYSSGESFSIADPNEVWVMEMIGKGPGNKGAVWVAIRIPDDCVSAHANQARIQQFPLNDPENCLYAPDVITFARKKGYYTGSDADFSFAKAYAHSTSVHFASVKPVFVVLQQGKQRDGSICDIRPRQEHRPHATLYQAGQKTECSGHSDGYARSLRRN